MDGVRSWPLEKFGITWPDTAGLMRTLRSWSPAILFGLRFWAAVSLALYIAFWLQLDNAQWAGTSAAVVCQPSLGASLRKGWFRMIGTIIGAVMIVVLTAFFLQSRVGFLLSLALWGAAAAFMATILRNFASYAAALAGYTAIIIASDELGATGGASGQVFILAVTRASEICIGIVSAGVVLAGTDLGGARRRLAVKLAAVSTDISRGLVKTFSLTRPELSQTRSARHDLIRQVIALDPLIDEVIGESSELRYHSSRLQATTGGLFAAMSCWRTTAVHLEVLPDDQRRREAGPIEHDLPTELHSPPIQGEPATWASDLRRVRDECAHAIRALAALPSQTPSRQLLADQTAGALIGLRRALEGLMLLVNPARPARRTHWDWPTVPDYLPPAINAVRAFFTIVAMQLIWVGTAWPDGALAFTFAGIIVVLFAPKADMVHAGAMLLVIGSCLLVVLAAIINFGILPGVTSFFGFSLAIGLVLVPAATLIAKSWHPLLFMTPALLLIAVLAPANQMTYNTEQFYNVALAIVLGVSAAVLSFRLVPPLSPALRTRRLLNLTLRDLRRLTTNPAPWTSDWAKSCFGRLSQLPEQAEPLQRAQLMAALVVGTQIIRLRRVARRLDRDIELDAALAAVSRGDSAGAIEHLARLDRGLAALPTERMRERIKLRARASILAISEALEQHAPYFSSAVSR